MSGLFYIFIIYLVSLALCCLVKVVYQKVKKKEVENPTSKIYYITNKAPKRKKTIKKPDIAIKGSIIDKDEEN